MRSFSEVITSSFSTIRDAIQILTHPGEYLVASLDDILDEREQQDAISLLSPCLNHTLDCTALGLILVGLSALGVGNENEDYSVMGYGLAITLTTAIVWGLMKFAPPENNLEEEPLLGGPALHL